MKSLNKIYNVTLITVGLAMLFAQSCTDTEYEQLLQPYNTIESYRIAGYGEIDSVEAVISGDSILIYWDSKAELPATITPSILISSGATISPASGEEVAFSENTVYTVTAEDGTTRQYQLKPRLNQAIPVVTSASATTRWMAGTAFNINGQYFIPEGDKSVIRVYAQRVRDGFEFDMTVDTASTTTTRIVAYLPEFTAEQDSGTHRIFVHVGNFPSNDVETYIYHPAISNANTSFELVESGQPVRLGDDLTLRYSITDDHDGIVARYFTKENITSLRLRVTTPPNVLSGVNVSITDLTLTDDEIKFVLPEDDATLLARLGYFIGGITVLFSTGNTTYTLPNYETFVTAKE